MAKGTIELTNNLPQIKGEVKKAALKWLEETAGELESQTVRASTSDTGQTKGSWTHQVDTSATEAVVGSSNINAIYEEYGTGEYAAEGNGRTTPWYVPVEAVAGSKKPSFHGKVIIVHGKGGKKFYKTNGKQPKMMLHNSWKGVIPKAKKHLPELLKKINV